MFNPNEKIEANNIKAIFIGIFLITIIAATTLFKSNSAKKNTPKSKKESSQAETIDSTKVEKITSEELAKKIQANSDLILIDLRSKSQYKAEHIIDSINIQSSAIDSLSNTSSKSKLYVLIEESGEVAIINAIANILSAKGYEKISYLDGGFNTWKKNLYPTISDGNQQSFTDQAKVSYISSDELKKRMETEKNIFIIDVRENTEFNTGHLVGATNIFLDDIEKKRKEIPLGKLIILYDNTSLGAFKGATKLFDLGIFNALALSDGLDIWKNKGYEINK
jgi:hydroxyacylglutathione hydrolase